MAVKPRITTISTSKANSASAAPARRAIVRQSRLRHLLRAVCARSDADGAGVAAVVDPLQRIQLALDGGEDQAGAADKRAGEPQQTDDEMQARPEQSCVVADDSPERWRERKRSLPSSGLQATNRQEQAEQGRAAVKNQRAAYPSGRA